MARISHGKLESELNKRGYRCDCPEGLDSSRRIVYEKRNMRVLTASQDRPFWTVQKLTGERVSWFVDFPCDVDIVAVFAFIDASA